MSEPTKMYIPQARQDEIWQECKQRYQNAKGVILNGNQMSFDETQITGFIQGDRFPDKWTVVYQGRFVALATHDGGQLIWNTPYFDQAKIKFIYGDVICTRNGDPISKKTKVRLPESPPLEAVRERENIGWVPGMNPYLGKIGEVVDIESEDRSVKITADGKKYWYAVEWLEVVL